MYHVYSSCKFFGARRCHVIYVRIVFVYVLQPISSAGCIVVVVIIVIPKKTFTYFPFLYLFYPSSILYFVSLLLYLIVLSCLIVLCEQVNVIPKYLTKMRDLCQLRFYTAKMEEFDTFSANIVYSIGYDVLENECSISKVGLQSIVLT